MDAALYEIIEYSRSGASFLCDVDKCDHIFCLHSTSREELLLALYNFSRALSRSQQRWTFSCLGPLATRQLLPFFQHISDAYDRYGYAISGTVKEKGEPPKYTEISLDADIDDALEAISELRNALGFDLYIGAWLFASTNIEQLSLSRKFSSGKFYFHKDALVGLVSNFDFDTIYFFARNLDELVRLAESFNIKKR